MRTLIGGAVVVAALSVAAPAAADTMGPGQVIYGPSGKLDSVYTTMRVPTTTTKVSIHKVRRAHPRWFHRQHPHREHWRFRTVHRTRTVSHNFLYGWFSNSSVWQMRQLPDGKLVDDKTLFERSPAGSVDACGMHPTNVVKLSSTHWIAAYHAEEAAPGETCDTNRTDKHTRWTLRLISTFNGGKTWHKGGPLIWQDDLLRRWDNMGCDDAGEGHLVKADSWLYLMYDACNRVDQGRRESIARAPLSSGGASGSWMKYFNGDFTEPGLGGQQSSLANLPTGARGVTWNTYLNEYVNVSVHIGGIKLFTSPDLINWTQRSVLLETGLKGSAWGHCYTSPCPAAYGYGSSIGLTGSSDVTGQQFYVYYMYKPPDQPFSQRVERRALVDLTPTQ